MDSIKDSSMTKRNKQIATIYAVLLAVYNRLKEKSNKNRMVKELSTNKGKISKQKTIKYLNNNLDEADKLLNTISASESNEQAANNIISNITNYKEIFDVPFPSGIPAPSPTPTQPTPSPTPTQPTPSPTPTKIKIKELPMEERRIEIKETQAQAISRGEEQLENPNPQINASSVLPQPTEEARQIEREQATQLSRMTPDDIIAQYSDLLEQSVRLPPQGGPDVQRRRANIQSLMNLLSERYESITNQVLNQQSLIDAFDEENRNVRTPTRAMSVNMSDVDLELGQPAAPEPGASGDPIEDVQQEAVSGGSEQVQQTENIDRPLNIDRFNEAVRQSTQLNERSINELTRQAPEAVRSQVREILRGNVSAQNILRGVVGLGMLYAGVSPAAQTVINSVLDIAQNSGVNVDRYFNRDTDMPILTREAVQENRIFLNAFTELGNRDLEIIRQRLIELGVPEDLINLDDINLNVNEFDIEDPTIQYITESRRLNFITQLREIINESGGQPLSEGTIGEVDNILSIRKFEKKETIEETRQEQEGKESRTERETVDVGTGAAGIGVGIAAVGGAIVGGATTGLGGAIGGTLGGAAAARRGAGVGGALGAAAVGGLAGEAVERLVRAPITVPPDTLKVIQQEDKGTGKLRPKFIIPSVDILQPTNQQIQADQDEWNMFDFVNPTSEGANGTAATNPLKLQALQENEIRFRDSGVDVHPMFSDDLPFTNEQLTEYFIGAPLPALPEMKFQENEEEFFDSRGAPQLSLWQRHGGYDPQNQSVAIEIQSPFRNFTNVTQLDEDINNSILYGSIPFIPNH